MSQNSSYSEKTVRIWPIMHVYLDIIRKVIMFSTTPTLIMAEFPWEKLLRQIKRIFFALQESMNFMFVHPNRKKCFSQQKFAGTYLCVAKYATMWSC